jgi:L-asparaginase
MSTKPRVLIIYTGGTIGMIRDEKSGVLTPFHLEKVFQSIPSIQQLGIDIQAVELDRIIDSSNVTPAVWLQLAQIIDQHYEQFDGFVILHGSDTMAYSASALSFLLEGLAKPVIFTGSQLPIGLPRTDARENLITALSIAAMKKTDGLSLVPEVCIYFEDQLFRGNRTFKYNSENFDAFASRNYPILAEAGVRIKIFEERLLSSTDQAFKVHDQLSQKVAVVKLFPGLNLRPYSKLYINLKIEVVIIESYGSGNGPTDESFLSAIQEMMDSDILVLNITQCSEGRVDMGKYETSAALKKMGVLNGADLTAEAAITKAMFVLATESNKTKRRQLLENPLRGEMTL